MPTIEVASPFRPLYDQAHPAYGIRHLCFYGGRGSAKSWAVARALLLRGTLKPTRILCTREFQNSIQDSVLKLLVDQIDALGLGWFYQPLKTTIRGANGTEFLFKGLRHNIQSIKSTEGIDIAWLEEAQTASAESLSVLIPTVRKAGSQLIYTLNPDQESDPVYARYALNPPPNCYSQAVNYSANPWFPPELETERLQLLAADPDAHDHIWGGKPWTRSKAQVLHGKWAVEAFTPAGDWAGPYYGIDWGFSSDPTAGVKLWISGRTLYVEHEVYGRGIELDDLADRLRELPDLEGSLARADNARPETISHVRKAGLNVVPAKKWAGCVEDGIQTIRNFDRVVIHPRCKHAAEEARLWSYKVDRLTGEVMPALIGTHDHIWDAVRYALEPLVGVDVGGRPVYPGFKARDHVSALGLWPIKKRTIFMGFDLTESPTCVVAQVMPAGQVRILDEWVSTGTGVRDFAEQVVRPALRGKYAGCPVVAVGSRRMALPGNAGAIPIERTVADLIEGALEKVRIEPSYGTDHAAMVESVRYLLTAKTPEGRPMLIVDPSCSRLIRGFEGGYRYRAIGQADTRDTGEPEPTEEARPHIALAHLLTEVLYRLEKTARMA